jgi:rRNA maturation endonuclease Nob1
MARFLFELPEKVLQVIYVQLHCRSCGCAYAEHSQDACGTCGSWCNRPQTIEELLAMHGEDRLKELGLDELV